MSLLNLWDTKVHKRLTVEGEDCFNVREVPFPDTELIKP